MFSIWSFLIHTFLYLHCFYQGLSFLQVVALFFDVCDILCMFWGNFLASFLTDGVHLNDAENTIMTGFMLSLLESKRKYKPLYLFNLLFSDFLVEQGIGSPAHIAMEEGKMDNLNAALQEPSIWYFYFSSFPPHLFLSLYALCFYSPSCNNYSFNH